MMRKLEPKLRFPIYTKNWEIRKLEDFCQMKAGKFISASDIEENSSPDNFPCYGGNGIRGYVNKYSHNGEFSLIGRQGALCGNVNIAKGKFYATEHAVVVTVNSDIHTVWNYYLLGNLNLNQYATGQAQPGLSIQNIEKLKVVLPIYEEQQKIATFLTTVDEKINLLKNQKSELERYKKGVMQKIFSQELRFKDENGKEFPKWEDKRLGSLLIHKSVRNKDLKVLRVLSVSNTKGFILQSEQFADYRVASTDVSNYKIVEKNDIAYNPSRINVGSIASLKNFTNGIVSPMYVVFRLKPNFNISFFENLVQTHLFKHLVKVGCSGSVRDSLNFEDLEAFKLSIPSLEEQTKIANFLSALDEKIALNGEQIAKMEAWKKGLLQQMFV